MAQIISKTAKPKRCNVSSLTGSLANIILEDGEYMLVSTDNSIGPDGQGIFLAYVVGDGVTKCSNLTLYPINSEILGSITGDALSGSSNKYWLDAKSSDETYGQPITHTDAGYSVTDYIDVSQFYAISIYALYHCQNSSIYGKGGYCWYNENKEVIGGVVTITGGTFASKWFENIAIPSGAKYIRYTFYPGGITYYIGSGTSRVLSKSDIVNNLTDGGEELPLSAEQGKNLLGLTTFIESADTSEFTGASQDDAAITIEQVDGEWIITKPGSDGYRAAGLFIGSVPPGKMFTWDIEYTSTSSTNTNIRFSTKINTQQATHKSVGTFNKNFSHVTFTTTRDNYNYLTVTSTDMSNRSSITIHSIRVHIDHSVQDLGELLYENLSVLESVYTDPIKLYEDRVKLLDTLVHGSNFSCLLFSDIHGDTVNLSRITKFYDEFSNYFSCIINVGDTIEDAPGDVTWYWNLIGNREALLAIGNHDAWASGGVQNELEKKEYDLWIPPLVERVSDLVRPENADTNLLPYYYKDYNNIRVIVLSTYTHRLQRDLTWFNNVLADSITNSKKVIVVNHISHRIVAREGTTLAQRLSSPEDINNGFRSYLSGGSQQGYLDQPQGDTDNVGNGFLTAIKTFKEGGGTFITYFCGHSHRDFFTNFSGTTYEASHGLQSNITLSTSRGSYQNDNPKLYPDGVTGVDSFYMFSVDESLNIFKLIKIGIDVDYAMRPRRILTYDYVNNKLLIVS